MTPRGEAGRPEAGPGAGGALAGGAGPGQEPHPARQLRVAFVLGSASGGTLAHVASLATGCRQAGLAVSIFGPEQAPGMLTEDVPVTFIAIGARPRPVRDAATVTRLRGALGDWRPDVVHAHGIRAGAFCALALPGKPRGASPALVVTVHNAPPAGRSARVAYGLLERICARRAEVILGASADLVARMQALGAAQAVQFDVPAPAAQPPTAAQLARARADLGAAGRPVVLAAGRLAPQKGLDVLVDAAAAWQHRNPRPLTVVAGAGPLAAALRAQAGRAGADVLLLGSRSDVPALLAVADVVVVPSRWEARALFVQEAMRAGRPLVATRTGGTPELTGEDGAILVPAGDPAALAEAVCAVLEDQELAAGLGRAAQARSETFPVQEDAIRAALALYSRLAAGGSKVA